MHNSIRGGSFHGPVVQADTAHVTEGSTWIALQAVFKDLGRHEEAEEARRQADRATDDAHAALSESIAIITSRQVGDVGVDNG
ncbi:hypothetical protein ACWGKU_21125 [Kitasatospora sp. NPDC054768]